MDKRRDFLQKLSFGLITPALFGTSIWKEPKFEKDLGEMSWEEIRKLFPLEKNRIYLNNGTFGPSPKSVLDTIQDSFQHTNSTGEYGNPSSGRERIAAFLGIKKSELCLTHNTTEGINIMAWGLPLKKGDEVIITSHEHAGSAIPWLNRAKLDGIVLKVFKPSDTRNKNFELIKSLVTSRTKAIAIPHITCTTGTVFPIREIADFARERGIFTAIDGAHGAGTLKLNISELGCDFYAGCFHKWMLGPNGSGFLYVKEDLLDTLQVYQVGAYSEKGWELSESKANLKGYVETAHRYDFGTQSTPLHLGIVAAVDFHEKIGREKIELRVRELNDYLFNGLKELKGIEILTPEERESRISVVAFRIPGLDYQEIAKKLSKKKIRIRGVHEAGLNAIRVSTHIYNSKSEIDTLLGEIKTMLS
ncbi:aminotransferase class V-fold PLP-dependent enzyme [Algoriphagus sp. CAU 1675]|uniref:aminotransferase class V-fold PLP-dependent enzyme n=1 Tax=Algoriphagus sp. CAU 1675 TaxID=3032597 RepID=UPI0023DC9BF5|nr:aminotransferase class V-fold PLP-dependent enzyme [Algoriphagus sp. CAU 1675]MDF2158379.1 aminotransferase class V-fold PLP-dependent enzyme [Algoriphagus sp. CAU 1675]